MRMKQIYLWGLAVLFASMSGFALAGGQREEALSANARASLQKSMADTASTRTAFRNPADEKAWLNEMSKRLAKRIPDSAERMEFLTTVHWEA